MMLGGDGRCLVEMPLLDLHLLAQDVLKVADDVLTAIFDHNVL